MILPKKNNEVLFVDEGVLQRDRRRRSKIRKYNIRVNLIRYLPLLFLFFGLKYNLIVKLLFCAAWWCIATMFFDHRIIATVSPVINVWFGVPGSGKTSVAAWLSRSSRRQGFKVLSNVEIDGTYKLEESDLGKYDMSFDGDGCHVIYDEAQISGLDNRLHSNFSKSDKPQFFALHRHMGVRVDVFSQAYDVDKRVRDRAASSGLFYLKRFPIKGFVFYRRIKKILFIKKEDKQMMDGFEFTGLPRICYTRSVWSSFDTLDRSLCPKDQKDWKLWIDPEAPESELI